MSFLLVCASILPAETPSRPARPQSSLWDLSLVLYADVSDSRLMCPQVTFSEGGPGSNSTGSEVASMSSQLPDTPNSMVSSPIEAWAEAAWTDWTEHTVPVHPATPDPPPPTAPNNPPGCILTLWRQSWDFTTATHSNVHPEDASSWPVLHVHTWSQLPKREDMNLIPSIHGPLKKEKTLNPESYTCCVLRWMEKTVTGDFIIRYMHIIIWQTSGGEQHCFSSFNFTISFMTQVLKHLQQGIPLFCHKLRGTFVWVSVRPRIFFFSFPKMCIINNKLKNTVSSGKNVSFVPVQQKLFIIYCRQICHLLCNFLNWSKNKQTKKTGVWFVDFLSKI